MNLPKKDDHIVEKLEKEYNVKVLMFNWDSFGFLWHRPVDNAYEAAPYLADVISKIQEYQSRNPESKQIPISLLVHSMGNIVLHQALEKDLTLANKSGNLFTNILMTGSDEDAESHNLWIERLKSKGTILLTINRNDAVLSLSWHDGDNTPLGSNPKEPLATNAYYLDVSNHIGGVHRVFQKGKMHGQVSVCKIVTSMLRGESLRLSSELIDGTPALGQLIKPVKNINKADSCFAGSPDEPDVYPDEE